MTQTDSCRMAVYDNGGNLLGYKTDTFWVLDKKPEFAKIHPSECCGLEGHLIGNLIVLSNEGGLFPKLGTEKIPEEGYRVNVERIKSDGILDEVIAKYQVMKNSTGKYIATLRSD